MLHDLREEYNTEDSGKLTEYEDFKKEQMGVTQRMGTGNYCQRILSATLYELGKYGK